MAVYDDHQREIQRRYYLKNRLAIMGRQAAYYNAHPEKELAVKVYQAARRARNRKEQS